MQSYNKLSPAQVEALAILSEECAEVIQAVNKILRHGVESFNPDSPMDGNNTEQLESELVDLEVAKTMCYQNGLITKISATGPEYKMAAEKKMKYLRHAKFSIWGGQ